MRSNDLAANGEIATQAGAAPETAAAERLSPAVSLTGERDRRLIRALHDIERLQLPDIGAITASQVEPDALLVELKPRSPGLHTDIGLWLKTVWPEVREAVLRNLPLLGVPKHGLRNLPLGVPLEARILSEIFRNCGGLWAQICRVELAMGGTSDSRVLVNLRGDLPRFAERIPFACDRLEQVVGVTTEIFPRTADGPELRSMRAGALMDLSTFRRPSFFARMDDPKPKLLRDPLDLRALQWWSYDPPTATLLEDAFAIRTTPLGTSVLVAYPLGIWSSGFQPGDKEARVLFMAGMITPRGTVERVRVGQAVISEPIFLNRERKPDGDTKASWDAAQKSAAEAIEAWSGRTLQDATPERLLGLIVDFSRYCLIKSLHRSTASFLATSFYSAREARVARAVDLEPYDDRIGLKSRNNGGLLNQEQLYRILLGHAPLARHRFEALVTK